MLLKEILASQGKQQKELAEALKIDKVQMSEIANYKCLPTPKQALAMCEYLSCNILDIYNKKEIDLILGAKRKSNNIDSIIYYRLSVRLNKASCNCLKLDNLNKLGYKTIKEWVESCINDLSNNIKKLKEEQIKNEK